MTDRKMRQTILVNGQPRSYATQQNVRELPVACTIDPDRPGFAVAVNADIVPRALWSTTTIQPDDRVEIVHALSGG